LKSKSNHERICSENKNIYTSYFKCAKTEPDLVSKFVDNLQFNLNYEYNTENPVTLENNLNNNTINDFDNITFEREIHQFDSIGYDVDTSLLHQQKSHLDSNVKEKYDNDGEYQAGVLLLDLLNQTKCPLNMFEKIVEWAIHCSINYQVSFSASTKITRNDILNKTIEKYNWSGLKPIQSTLALTACKESVVVVHFDFKQALYTILTDTKLMQKENLLDSKKWAKESKILNDLDTGYAFEN